jgi:hypothetical protein
MAKLLRRERMDFSGLPTNSLDKQCPGRLIGVKLKLNR